MNGLLSALDESASVCARDMRVLVAGSRGVSNGKRGRRMNWCTCAQASAFCNANCRRNDASLTHVGADAGARI